MDEMDERMGKVELAIAVIANRLDYHDKLPIHPGAAERLSAVEKTVFELRLDFNVFRAQVFAWAGAGAILGSIFSNLVLDAIQKYLHP
jgi:hypothetical protein